MRRHEHLSATELDDLERLFDREYHNEFGPWNPDAPYGYSPADTHIMTFHGQALVAHVGFQSRLIAVGADEAVVAGTGRVLVDGGSRGTGLGGRAIRHTQQTMRDEAGVDFGFLGCRRDVMPFYLSTGWIQVHATERCVSRVDQGAIVVSHDGPILVCSSKRNSRQWPEREIDLRGTPW